MRQEGRYASDRSWAPFAVVQRETAFGGGVILQDARDAETLLECFPNIRSQAIAAAEAQRMLSVQRLRWTAHQVAAQLADILEESATLLDDVPPEVARREAFA